MRNSPNIKITESIIYYPDSLEQSRKKANSESIGLIQTEVWLSKVFDSYDKNRTGNLDWRQFKIFIEDTIKQGLIGKTNNQDAEFYMSRMDKNRDGLISKIEFISFFLDYYDKNAEFSPFKGRGNKENQIKNLPVGQRMGEENKIQKLVDEAFVKYDINKTGELDYVQLSNFVRMELGGRYTLSEIIHWADKDKNRLINRGQLYAFLKHIHGNHEKI